MKKNASHKKKISDLKIIAKNLINNSNYLSLSTTDNKKPWTTPLYFATDKDYNFYFISRKDTRHSKHIYRNASVSFCIFNSEDDSFTAQGIQASGIASEVSFKDIPQAIKTIYKKKYPDLDDFKKHKPTIKEFTGLINCRIYKVVLKKLYLLDPGNPDMDTRVEVQII